MTKDDLPYLHHKGIRMRNLLNERQQRLYQWLLDLGCNMTAANFLPHEFIRKSGFLATQEAVERVKADLMKMEEDGWVLIGPRTEAGHMVMVTDKMTKTLLLPFERMVFVHSLMSDVERAMLSSWEKLHLGRDDQLATSDWPGWPVVIKRISH